MLKKGKKRVMWLIIFTLLVIAIAGFVIWQNNDIVVSRTDYKNKKIPEAFRGFTIVHISDLHNKMFGKKQERLLEVIKNENPDSIVITGDLIDRRRYRLQPALLFIEGAVRLAPVYYVCGNHEILSGNYEKIKMELEQRNVIVLEDEMKEIVKDGEKIAIFGMKDPGGRDSAGKEEEAEETMRAWTDACGADEEAFKILLSHRPEMVSAYAAGHMDLVFSGHAHGGQFRLPGIGGLIAPQQGLFPEYTAGYYQKKDTTMFVSRGLGNSLVPVRLFNRPEVVAVTLFPSTAK